MAAAATSPLHSTRLSAKHNEVALERRLGQSNALERKNRVNRLEFMQFFCFGDALDEASARQRRPVPRPFT
jgi:hypothetical protein